MHINRPMNSDVGKVGQDKGMATDQIFSLKSLLEDFL